MRYASISGRRTGKSSYSFESPTCFNVGIRRVNEIKLTFGIIRVDKKTRVVVVKKISVAGKDERKE